MVTFGHNTTHRISANLQPLAPFIYILWIYSSSPSRGDKSVLELQKTRNGLFTIFSDHLLLTGGRQSLLQRMISKKEHQFSSPSSMAEHMSPSFWGRETLVSILLPPLMAMLPSQSPHLLQLLRDNPRDRGARVKTSLSPIERWDDIC